MTLDPSIEASVKISLGLSTYFLRISGLALYGINLSCFSSALFFCRRAWLFLFIAARYFGFDDGIFDDSGKDRLGDEGHEDRGERENSPVGEGGGEGSGEERGESENGSEFPNAWAKSTLCLR